MDSTLPQPNNNMSLVNGHRVPTASSIHQMSECDRWWWRCAQGGITHHPAHKVISGFLIGTQHGSEGEFLNGNTIITRVARTTGNRASLFDSRLRHAQKAMVEKRCIGVIICRNHATLAEQDIQLPSGETFAVLGTWWIITDLWVDWQRDSAQASTKVLMAKLELVDEEASPCWWMQAAAAPPSSTAAALAAAAAPVASASSCATCHQLLVPRYVGEAFCGRPGCDSSNTADSTGHLQGKRAYRPEYIASRADKSQCAPSHHTYLPPPPAQLGKHEFARLVREGNLHGGDDDDDDDNDDDENSQGMVSKPGWHAYLCRSCYAFNQRTNWSYLECRRCRAVQYIRLPDMDVTDLLRRPFADLGRGGGGDQQRERDDAFFEANIAPLIRVGKGVVGRARIHTSRYIFERFDLGDGNRVLVGFPTWNTIVTDVAPKFRHLWGLTTTTSTPMPGLLHRPPPSIDLVRGPTKVALRPEHETLTAWFGFNFGIPYVDARMKMTSAPLDQAPGVIRRMMDDLMRDVGEALAHGTTTGDGDDHAPAFNESLLIGNYPGQGMGWHRDGEKSLVGNTVASISLGDVAYMAFALTDKYYTGRLHRGKMCARADDPIMPGAAKESEKREIQAQHSEGKLSLDEASTKMSALAKGVGAVARRARGKMVAPTGVLHFPLPFGAIMVQQGATLNDIYLHSVEMAHDSLARFVLTGRTLSVPPSGDDDDKGGDGTA